MLYNKDWNSSPTAKLLRETADIIDTDGLSQYYLFSDGAYCIQGALMSAIGISDDIIGDGDGWSAVKKSPLHGVYTSALTAVCHSLGGEMGECTVSSVSVTRWNNDSARTKEVVVTKLREVADSLVTA